MAYDLLQHHKLSPTFWNKMLPFYFQRYLPAHHLKGIMMKWTVIDTISCPNTGIAFSGIVSLKMLKLIIWYEGSVIIPPGSVIEPFENSVKIDGEYTPMKIYNVTTFKQSAWKELKDKITCREGLLDDSALCLSPFRCALKVCPYGKERPQQSA